MQGPTGMHGAGLGDGLRPTVIVMVIAMLAVTAVGVPSRAASAAEDVGPSTEAPPAPSGEPEPGVVELDPEDQHPAEPLVDLANAGSAGGSLCLGFSGIDRDNPVAQLFRGEVVLSSRPPVQVRRGGRVDWRADPYGDATWRLWFQSLRWTGALIRSPDPAALDLATDIARDWVRNHEVARLQGQDAEAVRHRSNVLVCLRERIGPADWLDGALVAHARFLIDNYSGDWNHGLDDNLALFGVGCLLGRADLRATALRRTDSLALVALHPGGGSNEQALGYDQYVHRRFSLLMQQAERCGGSVAAATRSRVAALPRFLAHASKPNRLLPNIGDTFGYDSVENVPGTPMEYAHHGGAAGTPPGERAAIFPVGYVFGRSGWGKGERSFANESWWAGRFGPARQVHGHEDRMSVLWHARGRDLLTDSGHVGYERSAYRDWLRGPQAHNVMTVEGEPFRSAATRLTRSNLRVGADFVEFEDRSYPDFVRRRSVLVATDPDVMVVYDRASGPRRRAFAQRWHLPPDMSATPVGRSYVNAVPTQGNTRVVIAQVPFPGQVLPRGSTQVVRGRQQPLQGWRSYRVRERTPAPTVEMRRVGNATHHLTVLVGTRRTARVATSLTKGADGWYVLRVDVGGERLIARVSPGGWISRVQG